MTKCKLSWLFIILASLSQHAEAADKQLNTIKASKALKNCGEVKLYWAKLIAIADVNFSASNCDSFEAAKASQNKSLAFLFKRNISAKFFNDAANESFRNNLALTESLTNQLIKANEAFNENYQSVQAGDIYLILQDANKGITLYKNNTPLATSTDPKLSRHYLNIWLGDKPAIKRLKKLLILLFT